MARRQLLTDGVHRRSLQLDIPASAFAAYACRPQTMTDHARWLAAHLGLRPPTAADLPLMIEAAARVAWRIDRGEPIATAVVAVLRDTSVILPTVAVIGRAAIAGRARARKRAADRWKTLRRFAPALIEALEFRAARAHDPTLAALRLLADMNRSGKRNVPVDAPMPFRKDWRRLVLEKGRRTAACTRRPCSRPGYAQVWCMGSGSGLLLGSLDGLAAAQAHALDHLGKALRAIQPAPVPLGRPGQLEDQRERRPA